MRRFVLLLIFIILSAVTVSADGGGTVWGPGEGYTIAYLHSGLISENSENLLFFENLPITEFKIENLTNHNYEYNYAGYGNITVNSQVIMFFDNEKIPINYPIGGFPVILPIEYNGYQKWIEHFGNQIKDVNMQIIDPYNFLISSPSFSKNHVKFASKLNLGNFSDPISKLIRFQFIPSSSMEDYNITNGEINTKFDYNVDTGALFTYEYNFYSTINTTDGIKELHIFEELDFVAIIPPLNAFFKINFQFVPVIITIILLGRVVNKSRLFRLTKIASN